jgi:hypothetical protein
MQRTQAKEAKQATAKLKNRSLREETVDQPRERVPITASCVGNTSNSHDSSMEPNTRMVKQSTRIILDTERISEVVHQDTQSEELILHSERSGRAVRLPTRFR